MSLKIGDWKINDNGVEGTLRIIRVDENGEVVGAITGSVDGAGALRGTWDETSKTLTFACPMPPVVIPQGAPPPPPQQVYKGFLFSTPRNPAPGQDVVWTLT